jgi:hypothetical protein
MVQVGRHLDLSEADVRAGRKEAMRQSWAPSSLFFMTIIVAAEGNFSQYVALVPISVVFAIDFVSSLRSKWRQSELDVVWEEHRPHLVPVLCSALRADGVVVPLRLAQVGSVGVPAESVHWVPTRGIGW